MCKADLDWTLFVVQGRKEKFIRVVLSKDCLLPKNMYSADGELLVYPVEGQHTTWVTTKSQQGSIPKLLTKSSVSAVPDQDPSKHIGSSSDDKDYKKQFSYGNSSPKALLIEYFLELLKIASKSTSYSLTQRDNRRLHRLVNSAIDHAAKELLQCALERLDQAIDPGASAILQETTTRP
jgi:hypothetical protein